MHAPHASDEPEDDRDDDDSAGADSGGESDKETSDEDGERKARGAAAAATGRTAPRPPAETAAPAPPGSLALLPTGATPARRRRCPWALPRCSRLSQVEQSRYAALCLVLAEPGAGRRPGA